jgi:hypothetical protein
MLSPVAARPLPSSFAQSQAGSPPAHTVAVQTSVTETYSRTQQVEVRGFSAGPNLSGTDGVQAYKAVEAADTAVNPFAKSILTFIDAQIRRDVADGASADELKSRLEAGLKGFEEGYGDAFTQLSGLGLLDDQTRAEIEGTRSQVLAGIQKLADELGIDLEVPKPDPLQGSQATPATAPSTAAIAQASVLEPGKALLSAVLRDVQIIEQYQKAMKAETTYEHLGRARGAAQAQSYAYGVQENRDFSLRLRTADGDAVTIKMSADHSGSAQLTYGIGRDGSGASLSRQGSESSSLQFSVEGELDEDELRALNDLLTQVGTISEQFFQGDLGRAFELATELSFDRSEIASFDLALNMSRTEVVQSGFADNQPAAVQTREIPSGFSRFAENVIRAGDHAERLGQPRSLVADLLDWIASNQSHKPHSALLAPSARALL